MKKFILSVAALFISLTISANIQDIKGVWKSGNIEMTFLSDTLLIDDITCEGDCYTYSIDSANNIIHCKGEAFDTDTFSIQIISVSKEKLVIRYSDDEMLYSFKRKRIQKPTMDY